MNKKKKKMNKYKPGATPTTTIFRKGSSQVRHEQSIKLISIQLCMFQDDLLSSVSSSIHEASPESNPEMKQYDDSTEVCVCRLYMYKWKNHFSEMKKDIHGDNRS